MADDSIIVEDSISAELVSHWVPGLMAEVWLSDDDRLRLRYAHVAHSRPRF